MERALLLVAPTGAGKGTMASWLMAWHANQRKHVLFVVHRRELVQDMTERLAARKVKVIQSAFSKAYIRVISIQQLLNRRVPPVDLVVVDEAHHYAADEWRAAMENVETKRIVGFTATPQRADGRPLGDMFDALHNVVHYSELLKHGYIVPCRVLRPPRKLRNNEIARDPVDAYLHYGRGERTLIFVRRVHEALALKERLLAAGIAADAIHGGMQHAERDAVMEGLENGELQVVVNVYVLTEGVDVPHVTTVILARGCGHASTYLQIVGRALRAAPGKAEATLIDLVGASYKHGLPTEDRHYSLAGDGIERAAPEESEGNEDLEREDVIIETLDLELEEIAPHRKAGEVGVPQHVVPRKRTRNPTPQPRRLPDGRSRGGVFVSNGVYNLKWVEDGKKETLGLNTRERARALELLELYRKEGSSAVRAEVARTKCKPATVYWLRDAKMYALRPREQDGRRGPPQRLFTEDKAEAVELCALFVSGKLQEFQARILQGAFARGRRAAERMVQERKASIDSAYESQ